MRMTPGGLLPLMNPRGTVARAKRGPAGKVAHLGAPKKGLSRSAEIGTADPLLASILTNWVVEDDRITVRPGYIKLGQLPGSPPPKISVMVPFYGTPQRITAAAGTVIYSTAGEVLSTNWLSDKWAWTSASNLGTAKYTIMVNGADGVVAWDGGTAQANFVKKTLTATEGWVDPLKFDKVLAHMNRLWFADSQHLAVYYLPLQVMEGALKVLPVNAIFKRGGYIQAIYNWSIDGGVGLDDALAIFTSNGEVAIYSGVDPASDFSLVGIFRFDAPMSKESIINFGGDLYVMISTGLVPMTTLIRAETEQLGKADQNVMKEFEDVSKVNRLEYGWQVMLNHHTGHAICNMPLGGGKYQQMIRKMPEQIWSKWLDIPSRCWGWMDNRAFFGSDDGGIYVGGSEYLNDNGAVINADVRFAWSNFGSVHKKNFKMVRLYTLTEGQPRPFVDMEVDYNNVPPTNQPELTSGPSGGASWDTGDGLGATWDVDSWAMTTAPKQNWQGVTGLGRVGAARVRVSVSGATLSLTGIDVLYELGGLM